MTPWRTLQYTEFFKDTLEGTAVSPWIGHLERENSTNRIFIGHLGELCRTGHLEKGNSTYRIF
jgi:hypothetical protein